MAKSKWPQIQQQLKQIEAWACDGLTEAQIARNCGVGKTAWESYKKAHPELKEALQRGRKPFIEDVRSALVKRALGFEIQEEKTYIKKNDDGTTTQYKEITTKYIPPSVGACVILLKNMDKEGNGGRGWSDDPARLDLQKEMAAFQRELSDKKFF